MGDFSRPQEFIAQRDIPGIAKEGDLVAYNPNCKRCPIVVAQEYGWEHLGTLVKHRDALLPCPPHDASGDPPPSDENPPSGRDRFLLVS